MGQVLDERYLLKSKLQEGHTSELYLATDLHTSRDVAVKKIYKDYVKETKDEVMIMKRLKHSKFIRLLDRGNKGQLMDRTGKVEDGITYIVMDLVRGENLFEFCTENFEDEGLGEDYGRFFMS